MMKRREFLKKSAVSALLVIGWSLPGEPATSAAYLRSGAAIDFQSGLLKLLPRTLPVTEIANWLKSVPAVGDGLTGDIEWILSQRGMPFAAIRDRISNDYIGHRCIRADGWFLSNTEVAIITQLVNAPNVH